MCRSGCLSGPFCVRAGAEHRRLGEFSGIRPWFSSGRGASAARIPGEPALHTVAVVSRGGHRARALDGLVAAGGAPSARGGLGRALGSSRCTSRGTTCSARGSSCCADDTVGRTCAIGSRSRERARCRVAPGVGFAGRAGCAGRDVLRASRSNGHGPGLRAWIVGTRVQPGAMTGEPRARSASAVRSASHTPEGEHGVAAGHVRC